MAEHLGAAVVAGYFFGEEHHDLDERVVSAVEKQWDRIINGDEALRFDTKKAGIAVPELLEPFPEERAQEKSILSIGEALSCNIQKIRQSGHNVIFASIAIRALHDQAEYATSAIVSGIRQSIEDFNGTAPGRGYYGKQRGWIVGI